MSPALITGQIGLRLAREAARRQSLRPDHQSRRGWGVAAPEAFEASYGVMLSCGQEESADVPPPIALRSYVEPRQFPQDHGRDRREFGLSLHRYRKLPVRMHLKMSRDCFADTQLGFCQNFPSAYAAW